MFEALMQMSGWKFFVLISASLVALMVFAGLLIEGVVSDQMVMAILSFIGGGVVTGGIQRAQTGKKRRWDGKDRRRRG